MSEDEVLFEVSTDSTQISIRIQDEYCRDSMSGYLFPQTVEATFQTAEMDTLRGCALFLNN